LQSKDLRQKNTKQRILSFAKIDDACIQNGNRQLGTSRSLASLCGGRAAPNSDEDRAEDPEKDPESAEDFSSSYGGSPTSYSDDEPQFKPAFYAVIGAGILLLLGGAVFAYFVWHRRTSLNKNKAAQVVQGSGTQQQQSAVMMTPVQQQKQQQQAGTAMLTVHQQQMFQVTIPAGVGPGVPFNVTIDNQILQIVCPEGCSPGSVVSVAAPAPAPVDVAATAVVGIMEPVTTASEIAIEVKDKDDAGAALAII